MPAYKIPKSVLVVVYTALDLQVLMLQRADGSGFWQSVTGSLEPGETPRQTAVRELQEETGLALSTGKLIETEHTTTFTIHPHWRHKYTPEHDTNLEYLFYFKLEKPLLVQPNPREHLQAIWVPATEAMSRAFSPSNIDAIEKLLKNRNL